MAEEIVTKPRRRKHHQPINKAGEVSRTWLKFFDKLKVFSSKNLNDWDYYDFLGYFIFRYKEKFNIDYSINMKSAPSSCPDIFMIKSIVLILNNSSGPYLYHYDKTIVKAYIDWVLETTNNSIISLGYLKNTKLINKFKFHWQQTQKLTRASKLPDDYINLASSIGLHLNTYGDLVFAKLALSNNSTSSDMLNYVLLFEKLSSECNFDPLILEKIVD